MRRTLLRLAAALALLPATAAPATTIWPEIPHDPKQACAAIERLVEGLAAGRLRSADDPFAGPAFYSDVFGKVDKEEEQAFLDSLRHSEGKPDRRPIRLYHAYSVHRDKQMPTYLVLLQRLAWHETSLHSNDDLNALSVERVADPHYNPDLSYWLATFDSDRIAHFREAPELYRLTGEKSELKRCPK